MGSFTLTATGNAAMASGGMGDVLTGIIAALLAQNYSPEDACILGNYMHGKAGDELALPNRMYVVLPGTSDYPAARYHRKIDGIKKADVVLPIRSFH